MHYDTCNVHKISYSEMDGSMLDFDGKLSQKKDSVKIIMLGIESSERIERDAVASDLEMTLLNNLYY